MEATILKQATRSRSANKLFRRQQLIDATIDCIDQLGFADTTLAKVAARAGLSQGIVIFHFKTKEGLFAETLRYLTEEYAATWTKALKKSPDTPIDRICTLIKSDFDPKNCNETKIGIWYAFWGESKSRPEYREQYNQTDSELMAIIRQECIKLSASKTARMDGHTASLVIESMVNGLWQKCLMTPDKFDRKLALNATLDIVSALYPDCEAAVEIYKRKLK